MGLCLGLSALTACGSGGPAGRDLIGAAGEAEPSFLLVELSEPSLDVVAGWHRPSFSAVFGDYRGPKVQKVDVGDTVQINIWETGGGGLFTTPSVDRINPGSRQASIPDQVVARDGTINVPYAGRIRVAGKTPYRGGAEDRRAPRRQDRRSAGDGQPDAEHQPFRDGDG